MHTNTNRGLWVVLGGLLLVVLVGPMLGGGMMGPGMMGWWGGQGTPYSGGGWQWGLGMGLGWLAMLAIWGAVIVGGILLVRSLGGSSESAAAPHPETPQDILKRRLAAGEIPPEEYERLRQALDRP